MIDYKEQNKSCQAILLEPKTFLNQPKLPKATLNAPNFQKLANKKKQLVQKSRINVYFLYLHDLLPKILLTQICISNLSNLS